MSRFNKGAVKPARTSPLTTATQPTGQTFNGAPGYAHDAKTELFLLAVSNMVGESTFYEGAEVRDDRYAALVARVAVTDPAWTLEFLGWLRDKAGMRSASMVGAVEAVRARLVVKEQGINRQIISSVLLRADEPGEMLAYYMNHYGRAVPKPIKRGIADAATRLYNGKALLKYDTPSHGVRFADVLELCHPAAKAPWQADLFRYAIDRRHKRGSQVPESLRTLTYHEHMSKRVQEGDLSVLTDTQKLREAGITWEKALTLAGDRVPKKALWEALIPNMGIMALARNLRNFDEAGVSDEVARTVMDLFEQPALVRQSRMFPFRWLAAYRNAPSLRWGHSLELALQASLQLVPLLAGPTLILVDQSGSMHGFNGKSDMTYADTACIFGAALALRNPHATLVKYGTGAQEVQYSEAVPVLKLVEKLKGNMGGTDTHGTLHKYYNGHQRIIIVTDEQADGAGWGYRAFVAPDGVSLYNWNLAGYQHTSHPGRPNHFWLGGMSDKMFEVLGLLEAGRNGVWPWQLTPTDQEIYEMQEAAAATNAEREDRHE